jgi:hypothetical protein
MPDIKHDIISQIMAWKIFGAPPTPAYVWPGINDLV